MNVICYAAKLLDDIHDNVDEHKGKIQNEHSICRIFTRIKLLFGLFII